ncbi:MAG TPA: thioredoxin family protein [Verrucomicrobiae bacterium]|nr:thioredoxin family protein [Verrucomicrobiae bacterium]
MRTVLKFFAALFLAGNIAHAAHTQAELLLSADTVKPGDTIYAGLVLRMDPDWHTYWKNPGDAGLATQIKWQLPNGISAGEIEWPLPQKFITADITIYGYENEVMLVVPLTIASNAVFSTNQIELKAKVSWLECDPQVCIPAGQEVETKLNIGSATKPSPFAADIESWREKQPFAMTGSSTDYAWWQTTGTNDTRILVIGHLTPKKTNSISFNVVKYDSVDFYPDVATNYEILGPTKVTSLFAEDIRLRKTVKKFDGNWPKQISGVLVLQRGDWRVGNETVVTVADQAPPDADVLEKSLTWKPPEPPKPLVVPQHILLLAFLGGLILNIMPCVLPVIALKILGFISEAGSRPRRVAKLGFIYAFGVLFSFLLLAEAVIAVKDAGHHAGWGMQFGNPVFVVCLVTLVTLVALNLFGVFEVTLSSQVMTAAGNVASQHGVLGAFFNGLLATALATPCTAPFLAPALGFAFSQDSSVIIIVFMAAGLGLATPYVVLSCCPFLLRLLPKPGPWMVKFKVAMGFPMLATTIWLFDLAANDYGKSVFWLGIFLVFVALAAWIFGEFYQRGRKLRPLGLLIALFVAGTGYVFALQSQLHWLEPVTPIATAEKSGGPINWQPWSPEAVAKARAAGHPVLVDFTADWCLTCQVNKKIAIEIPSIEKKLRDLNFVTLVADDTHTPDNISTELSRYNRAGVPLVLVFKPDTNAPADVLPQILTPSIVAGALDRAASSK